MITTFKELKEGDIFSTSVKSSSYYDSDLPHPSFLFIKKKEEKAYYAIFDFGECKFVALEGRRTISIPLNPDTEVVKLEIAN